MIYSMFTIRFGRLAGWITPKSGLHDYEDVKVMSIHALHVHSVFSFSEH